MTTPHADPVIDADDFTVENITFETPPAGRSALANASTVIGLVFRNWRFSLHDTILVNVTPIFRNCYIAGRDLSLAVHDVLRELSISLLTNGTSPRPRRGEQPFGFVFSHCKITGEPGRKTTWRPWRAFST